MGSARTLILRQGRYHAVPHPHEPFPTKTVWCTYSSQCYPQWPAALGVGTREKHRSAVGTTTAPPWPPVTAYVRTFDRRRLEGDARECVEPCVMEHLPTGRLGGPWQDPPHHEDGDLKRFGGRAIKGVDVRGIKDFEAPASPNEGRPVRSGVKTQREPAKIHRRLATPVTRPGSPPSAHCRR